MKFEEYKIKLKNLCLTKQTFHTLKQDKEFTAVYMPSRIIITPISSNKERPVSINDFNRIWKIAKNLPMEERYDPVKYQHITVNASYIVTLFKQILQEEPLE